MIMYLKRFFTLLAYRREIHDVWNDETGLIVWLPLKLGRLANAKAMDAWLEDQLCNTVES